MLFIKYLQTSSYVRKFVYEKTTIFGKAYYCDKKQSIVNRNPGKEKKFVQDDDTPKNKSSDEIEKNAFENEEEIMHVIVTEKERDASVRSRLSKECSALIPDKKISLMSSGLNLHIEHIDKSKLTGWDGYEFDQTIKTLKKQVLAPVVSAGCKETGGGGPAASSPSGSSNRIVRGEPGKVIFSVIPEEWWKFFIPKTGVSGFYTFLFTYGTFLISKEYYVMEHNFYNGLSIVVIWYFAITRLGTQTANFLDKLIDDYENSWNKDRADSKNMLEQQIENETLVQLQVEGQLMLLDAKRENVALQLEDEFRKRQLHVYEEVKKRLDYHVAIAQVHKRIHHKNLVHYVTREVHKSITPDMQAKLVNISIDSIITELGKLDNK